MRSSTDSPSAGWGFPTRALRLLVMDALERVEIAVRAALTDHMSTTHHAPHWYMDPRHFAHLGKHGRLLTIVRDTCDNRLRGAPDAGKRSDRTAIAKSIGLTTPVLEARMQTYVRVRNICAHHGRLWNVGPGVYPAIPTTPSISWLQGAGSLPKRSRKRLYPVLVSLQSVLDSVSPRSGSAKRLHDLLGTRPPMNLRGMGVPHDWVDDRFWSQHLA